MADLSQYVYDEDDANKPLLVYEARDIVERRLRVGKDYFYDYVKPILPERPILPGGKAKRIRKGDVETLCNLLLEVGPDRAEELVESEDVL